MHNIHIVVVNDCDNFEYAVSEADSILSDWGNENNYFTIEGGFDKDGNRFINDSDNNGRFFNDIKTVKQLKEFAANLFKFYGDEKEAQTLMKQAVESYFPYFKKSSSLKCSDWYAIEKYARFQYKLSEVDKTKDLFSGELGFFEYDFDELGITNLSNGTGENTFALVVDVHS